MATGIEPRSSRRDSTDRQRVPTHEDRPEHRGHPWIWWVLAAVLIVMVVGGVYWFSSGQHSHSRTGQDEGRNKAGDPGESRSSPAREGSH